MTSVGEDKTNSTEGTWGKTNRREGILLVHERERTGGRSFPSIFHSPVPSGKSWMTVVGSWWTEDSRMTSKQQQNELSQRNYHQLPAWSLIHNLIYFNSRNNVFYSYYVPTLGL